MRNKEIRRCGGGLLEIMRKGAPNRVNRWDKFHGRDADTLDVLVIGLTDEKRICLCESQMHRLSHVSHSRMSFSLHYFSSAV